MTQGAEPSLASVYPAESDLERFMRGELTRSETRTVVRHLLAGCESCRAEVERLELVTHALARSVPQVEPPPSLKAALMRTVNEEAALRAAAEGRAEPAVEPRGRRGLRERLAGLQPRIAVAGSLAVLALGVVIGVAAVKLSQGPGSRTLAAQVNHLGRGAASLELRSDDRRATVSLRGAPKPPPGRVYQLWIQRGKMIERGPVFTVDKNGRGSSTIHGGVGGADAVMMTVERSPGADAPTSAPIVRFNV